MHHLPAGRGSPLTIQALELCLHQGHDPVQRTHEGLGCCVRRHTPARARRHGETREIDQAGQVTAHPRRPVQAQVAQFAHVVRYQGPGTTHFQRRAFETAGQVELESNREVPVDRDLGRQGERLAGEPPGYHGKTARHRPARHAVEDLDGHAAGQDRAAQFGRQIFRQPARPQHADGRVVQLGDDDLSEGLFTLERHAVAQDLGPFLILHQVQEPHLGATRAGADVHAPAHRPETQQADAVLARDHLVVALARRQPALA